MKRAIGLVILAMLVAGCGQSQEARYRSDFTDAEDCIADYRTDRETCIDVFGEPEERISGGQPASITDTYNTMRDCLDGDADVASCEKEFLGDGVATEIARARTYDTRVQCDRNHADWICAYVFHDDVDAMLRANDLEPNQPQTKSTDTRKAREFATIGDVLLAADDAPVGRGVGASPVDYGGMMMVALRTKTGYIVKSRSSASDAWSEGALYTDGMAAASAIAQGMEANAGDFCRVRNLASFTGCRR